MSNINGNDVSNSLYVPYGGSDIADKFRSSSGTHLLDHLAADGAGLARGQVAVVAVSQVNTDFLGGLHLETIHSLPGLGDIQLIVVIVAHIDFSPSNQSGKQDAFRMESVFFFP